MAYKANILLGRITKLHGFEGSVSVKLEKEFIGKIPDMESVFLEIEGKPVPFFISESQYRGGDILRLKFSDYESVERVSAFSGCRVFLTEGERVDMMQDDQPDLSGFEVRLPDKSVTGTIADVIQNPEQWLLKVKTKEGQEILIPLHEDLILRIDKRKKIIYMDLPEGLTDINL